MGSCQDRRISVWGWGVVVIDRACRRLGLIGKLVSTPEEELVLLIINQFQDNNRNLISQSHSGSSLHDVTVTLRVVSQPNASTSSTNTPDRVALRWRMSILKITLIVFKYRPPTQPTCGSRSEMLCNTSEAAVNSRSFCFAVLRTYAKRVG